MWKEVLGVCLLAVVHAMNFQVAERLVHRVVLPYICSSAGIFQSSQSLQETLSKDLGKILQKPVQLKPNVEQTFIKPLLDSKTTIVEDKAIKKAARMLFDVSISFSLQIISLVLFEIIDLGNSAARVWDWEFTLSVLTFLLTYVNPSLLLFMGVSRLPLVSRVARVLSTKHKGLAFLLVFIAWALVFRTFNILATAASQIDNYSLFFSNTLIEVTMLGVTCLAALNGIGSVSSLYYSFVKKHKRVRKADIARGVETLRTTTELIHTRTTELAQSPTNSDLKNELGALNQMKRELLQDLSFLVANYHSQQYAATLRGKVSKWANVLFSLYCLYKIVNIMVIRLPIIYFEEFGLKSPKPDAQSADTLSVTIARIIAKHYDIGDYEDQLATNVSFVLSFFLFCCSFQSVVTTFHKLGKLLPSAKHQSTAPDSSLFFDLLVCELTGVYLLSTTLLLHTHLLASSLTLFDHDITFIDVWFDKCFGFGCTVSIVGLFISEQLEHFYRDDDDEFDHPTIYDEEALVEGRGKIN
ncbi:hypothetical protein KL930_002037 [Ogataea haglerorum]|uniref:Abscisic acid G-protein coupled receptor-like domain-containing protein n=1 Tax=Ogataea haglerorum TaxID=1937702 RepID=A0ABQ7RL99_9ASCO|nr:uncharacterized protein KL911_000358 [Ogataea haglerorum]KAG7699176.1 hypothetical protein KL915_001468 [Ogataea haglerorum]KAG7700778.1 hypothetical protein KL951_000893 [Ogataea haglerorum]KAG7710218.1 hypothetical protein KL914_001128 [Ogataea haglerorum]KAG7711001.1 hypothetical protein KL950_000967 [Ogataea haglerorum]KAG7720299.1 hypothetical protein KL913_001199 [Ogataea haglerorum]